METASLGAILPSPSSSRTAYRWPSMKPTKEVPLLSITLCDQESGKQIGSPTLSFARFLMRVRYSSSSPVQLDRRNSGGLNSQRVRPVSASNAISLLGSSFVCQNHSGQPLERRLRLWIARTMPQTPPAATAASSTSRRGRHGPLNHHRHLSSVCKNSSSRIANFMAFTTNGFTICISFPDVSVTYMYAMTPSGTSMGRIHDSRKQQPQHLPQIWRRRTCASAHAQARGIETDVSPMMGARPGFSPTPATTASLPPLPAMGPTATA
mmetsp:Transcript_41209/g.111391  ORF Transcript_41209/g.111391 Transcript_41209/m.111391 type:complete len:266 (-) Transcript_41209:821-1618(-)